MNNLTDKLSLKNNKPMKPFNRNFLTTSSKIFEKQTMLSQSVISSDIIMLDSATKIKAENEKFSQIFCV